MHDENLFRTKTKMLLHVFGVLLQAMRIYVDTARRCVSMIVNGLSAAVLLLPPAAFYDLGQLCIHRTGNSIKGGEFIANS